MLTIFDIFFKIFLHPSQFSNTPPQTIWTAIEPRI